MFGMVKFKAIGDRRQVSKPQVYSRPFSFGGWHWFWFTIVKP